MAVTLAGQTLSEAHRVAQGRIAAATATDLVRIWSLLDLRNLDATVDRWLEVAVPTIDRHRLRSQELSRLYFQRLRAAEAPDAGPTDLATFRPLPANQVTTSLLVTGPYSIMAGTDERTAMASNAAAASRQALSGGREVVMDSSEADPEVQRVRRLTAPGCCAFCAMLATRDQFPHTGGSLYFRAHDNCKCVPEPAWDSGEGQTRRAAEFARIYRESTDGVGSSGHKKLNAFRRALAAERAG